MKRIRVFFILSLLLLCVLSLVLVGCGSQKNRESVTTEASITVTYYEDERSKPVTVQIKDGVFFLNTIPQKPHSKFLGLFDALQGGVKVVNENGICTVSLTKSVILYAQWENVPCTVRLNAGEQGTLPREQRTMKVDYLGEIDVFPIPETVEGYDFIGWEGRNGLVSDGEEPLYEDGSWDEFYGLDETDTIRLTARYAKQKVTLSFVLAGEEVAPEPIVLEYGDPIDTGRFPQRTNGDEMIASWSTSQYNNVPLGSTATETVTLYPVWKRFKLFTFYETEDTMQKIPVTVGDPYTPYIPKRAGHTFLGWYPDPDFTGNEVETINYTTGVYSYYAKWQVETYTLIPNGNESAALAGRVSLSSAEPVTVTFGQPFSLPTASCDYCSFDGWTVNGAVCSTQGVWQIDVGDNGTEAHISAKWTKNFTPVRSVGDLSDLNESSGTFLLMNDIPEIGGLVPIASFSGVLDGMGHTLSGWRGVQNGVGNFGLIGDNRGIIKDLNITDFVLTNNDPNVYGTVFAGLLCAINNGTIQEVCVTAGRIEIDVASISHNQNSTAYVGAICGYNQGTISRSGVCDGCEISTYVGTKYQHAEAYCGCIAGFSQGGSVSDVYAHGNKIVTHVKADKDEGLFTSNQHGAPRGYTGGVIGYASGASITRALGHDNNLQTNVERNCGHNTNKESCTGSLIGKSQSTAYADCYSESGDTLFGDGSSPSGASKVNTDSIRVALLPNVFRNNGWQDVGGAPRVVG